MNKMIPAVAASMLLMACGGGSPTAQYVVNLDKAPAVSKGTNAQCDNANPQNVTTTYTGEDADQILSLFEEKTAPPTRSCRTSTARARARASTSSPARRTAMPTR